ncbi:MAG: hypothetical protein VW257_08075 [Quisquiliibacterium sp.]
MKRHQLEDQGVAVKIRYRSLDAVRAQAQNLLWLLCLAGREPGAAAMDKAQAAFRAGLAQMGLAQAGPPATDKPSLQAAREWFDQLRALAPLAKALLVKGLFAAASHDGTLRIAEVELLRLTGAVLDCPLPPLLTEIHPDMIKA